MKKLSNMSLVLLLIVLGLAVATTGCKKKTKKSSEDSKSGTNIETTNGSTPSNPSESPVSEMEADKARIQTVYFDFDRSDIRSDMRDEVKNNADIFRKWTDWAVSVEGHCDERGTNEYNLALGERRATAAKQALVAEGISASRMNTVSYGEERPVDPGHSESSWTRNRRAEFRVR